MEEKYRVGRKLGMVILDTKTSREVARATTEEMADNICKLLNHQSKVNNSVSDDVSVCFLFDFVNEFTDTVIPMEAIEETLKRLNEH